jgi:multiple sugar transport system substrate-binding protein
MKKSIRLTALAVSAVMAMGMLAGCGEKQEANGEITKVTYWTGESHAEAVERELINQWNETEGKKKGIEIEYTLQGGGSITQNLELALQSGTAPDFFGSGDMTSFAEKGYIQPYDDVMGSDIEKLKKKYEGKLKNTQDIYNGKIYHVPMAVTPQGLLYNKDMFKAAGIVDENGEAKPPTTIAEMREDAKKLTNADKKQYGIIYPKKWTGWFASDISNAAATYVGGRGAYNPATNDYDYSGVKPYAQLILDMRDDGSVYPGADSIDNDTARALFAEGNIGMKYGFSFDVGVLNDQFPAKCDWGVAELPMADAEHDYKYNVCYGRSCYVNAASKVPTEKLKAVLEFFLSDEYRRGLYEGGIYFPADASIIEGAKLENPKKGWEEFAKLIPDASEVHWGPNCDMAGLKGMQTLFLEDVWSGKMTIDDAIALATENQRKGREAYIATHPDYDTNQYANPDWKPQLKERAKNK